MMPEGWINEGPYSVQQHSIANLGGDGHPGYARTVGHFIEVPFLGGVVE